MPKNLTISCIALSLTLLCLNAAAVNQQDYLFRDKLLSIKLPTSMTLRNEYCTPHKVKNVHEDVFVLANYGAKDRKAAITGKLDPQVRSIVTIRRGKFDPKTGAAVSIVFLVDGIRQRRGLPVTVKERLDTYHAIKSVAVGGHEFKTYTLRIKSSPVVYQFYAGVIDQRLVSMIWTTYSKHPRKLNYYSSLAPQAVASLKLPKAA